MRARWAASMYEITMPKLGLDMESGRILIWRKQEGDQVRPGDVLFEVETEKVTMDVEADHSGYLRKIVQAAGAEVSVNVVVAYVGALDEVVPAPATPAPIAPKIEITPPARKIAPTVRIRISPLAKRTCYELGIDYHSQPIRGSAPGGRIIKADVVAYFEKRQIQGVAAASTEGAIKIRSATPLAGVRKVTARRMLKSKQTIPHITLNAKANATQLVDSRDRLKAGSNSAYGVNITYTDLLLKMCASALAKHRRINSAYLHDTHVIYQDINIGFAAAVGDSLVVPTIYQCDQLGLLDIVRNKTELVEKAQNGSLELDDVSNGTFTLTNLGMFRIRSSSPIINPPQAAILAVGEIYQEPVVVGGEIRTGFSVELSLACDHRLIDGAAGAKFLQHIVELIEEPF